MSTKTFLLTSLIYLKYINGLKPIIHPQRRSVTHVFLSYGISGPHTGVETKPRPQPQPQPQPQQQQQQQEEDKKNETSDVKFIFCEPRPPWQSFPAQIRFGRRRLANGSVT